MEDFLKDISYRINLSLQEIGVHEAEIAIYSTDDIPAIIAFYAASKLMGEDILHYENETIQIWLLRKNVLPAT
ncbi:MAG: hypothetical protein DRN17_04825, partial [Thermoplasmata archaeon]